jgi:hypothetical protein
MAVPCGRARCASRRRKAVQGVAVAVKPMADMPFRPSSSRTTCRSPLVWRCNLKQSGSPSRPTRRRRRRPTRRPATPDGPSGSTRAQRPRACLSRRTPRETMWRVCLTSLQGLACCCDCWQRVSRSGPAEARHVIGLADGALVLTSANRATETSGATVDSAGLKILRYDLAGVWLEYRQVRPSAPSRSLYRSLTSVSAVGSCFDFPRANLSC